MSNKDCPQIHQQFRELINLKEKFDSLFADGKSNEAYELKKQIQFKLKEIESLPYIAIGMAKSILDTHEDREKGLTNVLGPAEVEKAFGIELKSEEIPPIPFSRERLERAKELNQFLVFRVNKASDDSPFTIQKMVELLQPQFDQQNQGPILHHSVDKYWEGPICNEEVPRLSWALVSKEIIPESTEKSYLEQTQVIVDYLRNQVFKDQSLPPEYQEAVNEFDQLKNEIKDLIYYEGDIEKAAELLSKLKITQLTRQSPVEVIYDLLIYFQNNNQQRLLENNYTWTKASSENKFVIVGGFNNGDTPGAGVAGFELHTCDNRWNGVSISCRF